eukprot:COSAG01_NODE_6995_length_3399_cov_4.326061_5_plen_43_part_00
MLRATVQNWTIAEMNSRQTIAVCVTSIHSRSLRGSTTIDYQD